MSRRGRTHIEVRVLKVGVRDGKATARNLQHNTLALQDLLLEQIRQQEMSNMIRRKLPLNTILGKLEFFRRDNTSAVQQAVDLAIGGFSEKGFEFLGASADGGVVCCVELDEFDGSGWGCGLDLGEDGVDAGGGAAEEVDCRWGGGCEGEGCFGA
jgi:hypothetical protein